MIYIFTTKSPDNVCLACRWNRCLRAGQRKCNVILYVCIVVVTNDRKAKTRFGGWLRYGGAPVCTVRDRLTNGQTNTNCTDRLRSKLLKLLLSRSPSPPGPTKGAISVAKNADATRFYSDRACCPSCRASRAGGGEFVEPGGVVFRRRHRRRRRRAGGLFKTHEDVSRRVVITIMLYTTTKGVE